MNVSSLIALLLTFSALTTYLNHRFLRLSTTVALVLSSVGVSLLILLAGSLGFDWAGQAQASVRSIDFGEAFLNGTLSFLLFAGSLHVPLDELRVHRWPVAILATVGVLLSLLLVAGNLRGRRVLGRLAGANFPFHVTQLVVCLRHWFCEATCARNDAIKPWSTCRCTCDHRNTSCRQPTAWARRCLNQRSHPSLRVTSKDGKTLLAAK